MEKYEYKPRVTDDLLDFKLHAKGAVVIDGPKWCGKTTSARQFAKSEVNFSDSDESGRMIDFARMEPKKILEGATPRLFDEWQEVPALWDVIRSEVDRRNAVGQFILTGSSIKIPKGSKEDRRVHTGTGRFTYLLMRPMSLFESGESSGKVSLASLFKDERIAEESSLSLDELAFVTCRGGWPFSTFLEGNYALAQAKDYYSSIVNEDVSRVDNVQRNPLVVQKIMRSYAREQGQSVSVESIAADVGDVSADTVGSYLNALRRIYVIEDAMAWNPNLRSKTAIRTSNTCYFVDPSLAVASLRLNPEGLINDLNYFGFAFETLVMRDLRVYATPLEGKIYHYRDRFGLECDMVIVLPDGRYGLIQVKLGQTDEMIADATDKLQKMMKKIEQAGMDEPSFMAIITGNGKFAYKNEDGIYLVPIGCLGP